MGILKIERIGGLAGFGMEGSRVKSEGEISFSALSSADQSLVDGLFTAKSKATANSSRMRDGFRYRISRKGGSGMDVIEVDEAKVPVPLIATIKDRFE